MAMMLLRMKYSAKTRQSRGVQNKFSEAPMENLFNAYAAHKNIPVDDFSFTCNSNDGNKIKISPTHTAKMLNLEASDDRLVHVIIHVTFSNVFNLVIRSGSGEEITFKIKKDSQLNKAFAAYCERVGVALESVRFLFDGEAVRGEKTLRGIGMKQDYTVIEAVMEQTGGFSFRD